MSILDVSEDKIFETFGKGRDPKFRSIEKPEPVKEIKTMEKAKPVVSVPKKAYTFSQSSEPVRSEVTRSSGEIVKPAKSVQPPEVNNYLKLTSDLNQLRTRVDGIQKMIKLFIIPQVIIIIVLLIVLFAKS